MVWQDQTRHMTSHCETSSHQHRPRSLDIKHIHTDALAKYPFHYALPRTAIALRQARQAQTLTNKFNCPSSSSSDVSAMRAHTRKSDDRNPFVLSSHCLAPTVSATRTSGPSSGLVESSLHHRLPCHLSSVRFPILTFCDHLDIGKLCNFCECEGSLIHTVLEGLL